ncbi:putative membrane protein [Janthinobacterium agaricidamnosum NBRC 102515 = DSM 9628]|uniref:Putative membrane protein n=1 Tax=Janthinobacterium agaricidamnosum NBRC 102515 = DSM 9628 TaxID=1349767 RepID=W0V2K3_9BURK|nr:putative membrane protein [Janthinobacterium agaricidamnosum NBRC 102515 = DSM 9628]
MNLNKNRIKKNNAIPIRHFYMIGIIQAAPSGAASVLAYYFFG